MGPPAGAQAAGSSAGRWPSSAAVHLQAKAGLLVTSRAAPPPAGKHALWGTHNRCLALDATQPGGAYIEVIAIDPAAPPPPRPRWFGLDDPALQARLRDAGPQLLHWVARLRPGAGANLAQLAAQQPELVPPTVEMQRGNFSWSIGVPADGSLPGSAANGASAGGLVPSLIQWRSADTPVQRLPSTGLRLLHLRARHRAPEGVSATLAAMGASSMLELEQSASAAVPSLTAAIWSTATLRGLRTLF